MKQNLLIILLLIGHVLFGQENLFPVAQNGKWGLIDQNGNYVLEKAFDFIDYHKSADKFIYSSKSKKGIIGGDGKIISDPIYEQVILFSSRWSAFQEANKWGLIDEDKKLISPLYDSIQYLNNNLFLLFNNGKGSLFNATENIKSQPKYKSGKAYNTAILEVKRIDGKYDYFDRSETNLIAEQADTIKKVGYRYVEIKKKDESILLKTNSTEIVGKTMHSHEYQSGSYFISTNSSGDFFIFDAKTNRYHKTPQITNIVSVKHPILTYTKNGFTGVWNLATQKSIVSPFYENVAKTGDNYFVYNYGLNGIISKTGKTIIPPIYKNIDVYKYVYVVRDSSGLGVYSIGGKKLTDSKFKKVVVYDTNIKCYNDKMTLIKLKGGAIDYIKEFQEYISLTVDKKRFPRQRSTNLQLGNSLSNLEEAKIGWYQPILTRKVKDTTERYKGKWGLKGENDSIIIPPTYKSIRYLPEQNLTKGYLSALISTAQISSKQLKDKRLGLALSPSTIGIHQSPFVLVDHIAGKVVSKERFLSINFSDFENATLARAFQKGLCLINSQIEVIHKNLVYYGSYSNNILPICTSGERVLHPLKNHETASSTLDFLKNTGTIKNKISPYEQFISIKNGTWFYLNSKGEVLNEIAFEQAGQFKNGKAIVKSNKKWGVIDTNMQVIIPFEYAKIERIEIEDSTYFQLYKRVNEHYIYNRKSGSIVSTDIKELVNFSNGKWFMQQKGSDLWGLLDTNLKTLAPCEYSRHTPFKNGNSLVTLANKKTLINSQGKAILPTYKAKDMSSIGFDRYAIKGKRGFMIISINGDTLIQESQCKEVLESNKRYIIYKNKGRVISIFAAENNLSLPKNSSIKSYNLNASLLLLSKNNKAKIWSLSAQKYVHPKLSNIVSLGESSFVYRGDNGLLGYMSYSGDTLTDPLYKTLDPIKNGWGYAAKDRKIIRENNEAVFKEKVFRLRPTENNFLIYMPSGVGLIDKEANIIIPPNYLNIEKYNNKFYKAKLNNGKFELFTINGEKVTNKPFTDIKAIYKNELIVKHKGYDYLYEKGYLNKSLSFQNIQPISSGIYLLDEKWLTGISDINGNEIVPISYHKIEVIRKHFQVGFFNSFGYYNLNGEVLAEPHQN